MIIKPITVHLIIYGQKANLSAIRVRASDLLKEEHGAIDASLFVERPSADVHAEITATRFDSEVPLKKPTASQPGLAITLPEVNEKFTKEWLQDLPVAKTCVVFATWDSPRDQMRWQLLMADGGRWSESRPLTK